MEQTRFFHAQRCIAYGVTAVGAVIMWQIGMGTGRVLNEHGIGVLVSVAMEPEFLLRFAAATCAVLAGVAALADRDGTMLITGFATFLFMLVSLSVFSGQGNIGAWATQAVYLLTMAGLFLAMVVTRHAVVRREMEAQNTRETAPDDSAAQAA